MVTDLAKVIAVVNVFDSTFTDNYFTGEGSSLIYIQNGLISLRGNTFRNNGQIVSDQIYSIDGRFMHKYYQEHGDGGSIIRGPVSCLGTPPRM